MRLLRRGDNIYLRGGNPMLIDAFSCQLHLADSKSGDNVAQPFFRPANINQRAQQHITADAGGAVEVSNHRQTWIVPVVTDARSRVSMRCAAAAAPNPLSILTTVSPVAQLFSIPSKAASPPKLAPYPMLVGTAITQLSTNPPTTLGKAPSMPATTITTSASLR